MRIVCNICDGIFKAGNRKKDGLPNGLGFCCEGHIFSFCTPCLLRIAKESGYEEEVGKVKDKDSLARIAMGVASYIISMEEQEDKFADFMDEQDEKLNVIREEKEDGE